MKNTIVHCHLDKYALKLPYISLCVEPWLIDTLLSGNGNQTSFDIIKKMLSEKLNLADIALKEAGEATINIPTFGTIEVKLPYPSARYAEMVITRENREVRSGEFSEDSMRKFGVFKQQEPIIKAIAVQHGIPLSIDENSSDTHWMNIRPFANAINAFVSPITDIITLDPTHLATKLKEHWISDGMLFKLLELHNTSMHIGISCKNIMTSDWIKEIHRVPKFRNNATWFGPSSFIKHEKEKLQFSRNSDSCGNKSEATQYIQMFLVPNPNYNHQLDATNHPKSISTMANTLSAFLQLHS